MRRTKIVCTIGPATRGRVRAAALLRAGMDVARLNFSHGTHSDHARAIATLRELSAGREKPLAILQDLCGPKTRLGLLPEAVTLKRGQTVLFAPCESGSPPECIPLPVPQLFRALSPGDRLLADDGNVDLRVLECGPERIRARVLDGGVLTSRKGIAAPGIALDIPAVTPRDEDDLRFGLAHGVDWVAVSYVRGPEDIAPVRRIMKEAGVSRPVIAKVEKMEAVSRLDAILEAVDGVMVARGDLGIEAPIDQVPLLQKRIIRRCNQAGKPVITATQMLESMIQNARPTRAEVTDIANAILDGTDALMLSGETAIGAYPLEAVRIMGKVASNVDSVGADRSAIGFHGPGEVTESLAQAVVEMARSMKAAAILCATTSGATARLIAKYRPATPVYATTPFPETYRRLALSWGIRPLIVQKARDTDAMMEASITALVERRLARPGERVILTAGIPLYVAGNTNLIKVHVVGEPIRRG